MVYRREFCVLVLPRLDLKVGWVQTKVSGLGGLVKRVTKYKN